ncbi:MAG: hypothetical protein JWM02_3206 [Frankiales bacterium]|nr:hypothetical protein [Frankiales bacterium]
MIVGKGVRLHVLLLAGLCVAVVGVGTQMTAPLELVPQAASTLTPVADGYVVSTSPSTSYGTASTLRTDASPVTRSYLRFTVSGVGSQSVTFATLRVWANSAQSAGYVAHRLASTTWTEAGLTYATAPALGSALGSSGATVAGTWATANVTAAVTADGAVAFGLDTTSSTALSLSSREGAHPPQLVVQTSGPTPTPTPTGWPVIAAAGDIACDPADSAFNGGLGTGSTCRQKSVSDVIVGRGVARVLALGDNQYYCGGYDAWLGSYDKSWGRFKSLTAPVAGNHEYLTQAGSSGATGCDSTNAGAAGYFRYFGARAGPSGQGWYSFDVGAWHLVALNSQCSAIGGCSATSPQGQWLAADLAAHKNTCTLAFWHIPLFSSGGRAASNSKAFWQLLYDANAEVVLNGHDHTYERFAPQTAAGVADSARGLREFVVGTGGANHTALVTVAPNSVVRDSTTFGVLLLTLKPTSYSWVFVPAAGSGTFSDSGSASCH